MASMTLYELSNRLHEHVDELKRHIMPKFFHDMTLQQDKKNNRKYEGASDKQHAYNVYRCGPLLIEALMLNDSLDTYVAADLLADRVLLSLFGVFRDAGYFEEAMEFIANMDFRKVRNVNKYIHCTMSRWITEEKHCDLKEMTKNASAPPKVPKTSYKPPSSESSESPPPSPIVHEAPAPAPIFPAEVRMKASFACAHAQVLKDEPHRLIRDTTCEAVKTIAVQQSNGKYCILMLLTNIDSIEGFVVNRN